MVLVVYNQRINVDRHYQRKLMERYFPLFVDLSGRRFWLSVQDLLPTTNKDIEIRM